MSRESPDHCSGSPEPGRNEIPLCGAPRKNPGKGTSKAAFCIYTAVSGDYLPFKSLFEYCAGRACPLADVKVDVFDQVGGRYYAAVYRFLKTIEGYDYVLITDIDMLLLAPRGGLLNYYLRESQKTGGCYSNSSRSPKEKLGRRRLTGVHFCKSGWFERTEAARAKYMSLLNAGKLGRGFFDDETTLFRIVVESGLPLPPRLGLRERWCALHFSLTRAAHWHPDAERRRLDIRDPSGVCGLLTRRHLDAWRRWRADRVFCGLLDHAALSSPWMAAQIGVFDHLIDFSIPRSKCTQRGR
jgi:hypothetical protein